jgi:uncharacterized membrane protein
MTSKLLESVDIEVPVTKAYDQWTQFEEFPRFMKHVKAVRQVSDRMLHWTVSLGGQQKEFDAEIVEQIPDHRIAWRSLGAVQHAGVVTFHRLSDTRSRVTLQIDYEPAGFVEKLGDLVGVPRIQIEGELERFAEFVQKKGEATGSWRGTIPNRDEERREAVVDDGS